MGQPLTPTSSQEIIPISPPKFQPTKRPRPHSPSASASASASGSTSRSTSTTLPRPKAPKIGRKLTEAAIAYSNDFERRISRSKEEGGGKMGVEERGEMGGFSRGRVSERMLSTLGKRVNPITNSDLYSRTDHFVSSATGHQQSNRGGGGAGQATYWETRKAKMADQAREKNTDIFAGCTMYINGSTGPKVSNLQVQNLINQNGGRYSPHATSSCTHILADGGLSGTKTQKWINGQGGRGSSKRIKIVRVDWVLDCVERGMKLSEANYGVITDPSQPTLFTALGVKPKLALEALASSTSIFPLSSTKTEQKNQQNSSGKD